MRRRFALIVMSLALVLLTQRPLHAQLSESLTRLSDSVSRLPDLANETQEQRTARVVSANRIQTAIVAIRQTAGDRKVSSGFVKSLDLDSEALESVEKSKDTARRVDIIVAVAGDVGVKAGYVQTIKGDIDDITVNAVTRSGSAAQNGYEVWFVPAGHAGNPSRYDRFQTLSSPTRRLLPAGNYLMWSKKGAAEGTRIPVSVESGQQRQIAVDVPVPLPAGRGR